LFAGRKCYDKRLYIITYAGTESINPTQGNYVLQVNRKRFINAKSSIDTAGFANDCRTANRRRESAKETIVNFHPIYKTKKLVLLLQGDFTLSRKYVFLMAANIGSICRRSKAIEFSRKKSFSLGERV